MAQALSESKVAWAGDSTAEESNGRNRGLLRAGRQRPCRHAAEERDSSAEVSSGVLPITISA